PPCCPSLLSAFVAMPASDVAPCSEPRRLPWPWHRRAAMKGSGDASATRTRVADEAGYEAIRAPIVPPAQAHQPCCPPGRSGYGHGCATLVILAAALYRLADASPREGWGSLEHGWMHAVGRVVTIKEGLDVDDDFFAHVDAALDCRRAHVWQRHDAVAGEQLRVDGRLVLKHVETGTGDLARLQHASELVLIDHLAARGVDDVGGGLQQLQAPRGEQMVGGGRVRAVDGHDIHARQHLVQALPVGRLQLLFGILGDPAPIVVVDLQAERSGAARHRLADAAHADDAQPFAPDAVAEHPRGRPARPML